MLFCFHIFGNLAVFCFDNWQMLSKNYVFSSALHLSQWQEITIAPWWFWSYNSRFCVVKLHFNSTFKHNARSYTEISFWEQSVMGGTYVVFHLQYNCKWLERLVWSTFPAKKALTICHDKIFTSFMATLSLSLEVKVHTFVLF